MFKTNDSQKENKFWITEEKLKVWDDAGGRWREEIWNRALSNWFVFCFLCWNMSSSTIGMVVMLFTFTAVPLSIYKRVGPQKVLNKHLLKNKKIESRISTSWSCRVGKAGHDIPHWNSNQTHGAFQPLAVMMSSKVILGRTPTEELRFPSISLLKFTKTAALLPDSTFRAIIWKHNLVRRGIQYQCILILF